VGTSIRLSHIDELSEIHKDTPTVNELTRENCNEQQTLEFYRRGYNDEVDRRIGGPEDTCN
jgi:hypothetical protein